MPLTDTAIKAFKPESKPKKYADGQGLHLLVQPAGAKLWCFRYRFGGKEKMLSFGSYPEVSLKVARQRRDEARELLAQDIDPSAARPPLQPVKQGPRVVLVDQKLTTPQGSVAGRN